MQAENFFLSSGGVLKVGDFGSAVDETCSKMRVAGNMSYGPKG